MSGGYRCIAPGCKTNYRNSSVSLFRFPKDLDRARQWVLACGRTELLSKLETLHAVARICGYHFKSRLFLNTTRNRLQKNAVPSKFLHTQGSTSQPQASQTSRRKRRHTIFAAPTSNLLHSGLRVIGSVGHEENQENFTNRVSEQNPSLQSQKSDFPAITSPQSHASLDSKTCDLEKHIRKLQNENASLRKEIQENSLLQSHNILYEAAYARTKGKKYSAEFKSYSLSLYFLGPKLYRKVISTEGNLPRIGTLQNFVGQTHLPAGINENAIDLLKTKFDNFEHLYKFCVLCVGELKLTPGLYYGTSSDKIIGFQDMGNDEREFKPASVVLVIMARGFYFNWQQPIAYYFLNSACPGAKLKEIVLQQISELNKIKLRVIAVTCNMKRNITCMTRLLNITPESPYFTSGNQKVVLLYNTHTLLQITRNDLMKKSFVIGNKTTSWTHIRDYFDHDRKYSTRSATDLTELHLAPSKQVRRNLEYATAIFSTNVVNSMNLYVRFRALPPDANATVEFIKKNGDLFSTLNFRNTTKNRTFPEELELEEYYDFFDNLQVISNSGNNRISTTSSIIGWKTTVRGIIILREILNSENLKLPNKFTLNHKCLDSFFHSFTNRNGKSVNPIPIKFYKAYKKLFSKTLITSGISSCEEDYGKMKTKLKQMPSERYRSVMTNLLDLDLDYQRDARLAEDFTQNICPYLFQQCSAKHTCQICEDYIKTYHELNDTWLPYYINVYKSGDCFSIDELDSQNDNFIFFVASMEMLFQQNYEGLCYKSDVIHEFTTLFNKLDYQHPCQHFPYYYVFEMYARIRLFFTLKSINRNFRTNNGCDLIIWK